MRNPHTDAPNWPVFIGFADHEFKAKTEISRGAAHDGPTVMLHSLS